MKKPIEKYKLEQLDKLIEKMSNDIPNKKMKYVCYKNKASIKDEMEAITKIKEPSEKFKKYEEERTKLILPFVVKDDQGNPKQETVNGQVLVRFIPEKQQEVNELLTKFNEDHKDTIEEYKKELEEIEEVLKEKVEIDILQISFDDLPDYINDYDSELLFEYIVEDPKD